MPILWRDRPCDLPLPHLPGLTKRPGSSRDFPHPHTASGRFLLSLPHQVLVDSGSDDNVIDSATVKQAHILTLPLPTPKEVFALDDRLLACVTHRTVPLSLLLSGNHSEKIHLLIIPSPQSPVVLGLPWLRLHNPQIDWSLSRVVGWSVHCHATCLHSAASSCNLQTPVRLTHADLSLVPPPYHNLGDAFSKDRAHSLPPH